MFGCRMMRTVCLGNGCVFVDRWVRVGGCVLVNSWSMVGVVCVFWRMVVFWLVGMFLWMVGLELVCVCVCWPLRRELQVSEIPCLPKTHRKMISFDQIPCLRTTQREMITSH